jgi:hypothetical protein
MPSVAAIDVDPERLVAEYITMIPAIDRLLPIGCLLVDGG